MSNRKGLPQQQLPYKSKGKAWRKQHLDWADSMSCEFNSVTRRSVREKKINYDLISGVLHMSDLERVLNPSGLDTGYIPEHIQHYPIMNSKINVLLGEEAKRLFRWRAEVTNPTAINEIEESKKAEVYQRVLEMIQDPTLDEESYQKEVDKVAKDFAMNWQDARELRANLLLNHYSKEQDHQIIFNNGFHDAMTVGEEIYQCSIIGGEPVLERLNPAKVRIFRSSNSNKIEDADIIIIEDYWSPGRIYDVFYDSLSAADRKHIEELANGQAQSTGGIDEMGNYDATAGFIKAESIWGTGEVTDIASFFAADGGASGSGQLYDTDGNIKVLKMFWKSRRKVLKIKRYNPITGDTEYDLMTEDYIPNEMMGEEAETLWINEAWQGYKIGSKIYADIKPCPIQYNRLSNPSRCHFGIIGSLYNVNQNKPFSLVDMMKRYNYLYDVIHDRLNRLLDKGWGRIVQLDFAKIPDDWDIEKWMYYAKVAGIAVTDSFKEGSYGAATGKLAGGLNNAHSGVIDASFGNEIQHLIHLLEYIKNEMSEVIGISKQREGQISNRETVGGVERATLQSSHITEYLFMTHNSVKKRVLNCFLETAKIAMQGKSLKLQYITPDNARKMLDIDGDLFAEADYGIIVDSENESLELEQKIDMLAQAALQNQMLTFSSIMQLYGTASVSEKQHIIKQAEEEMYERQQQAQEQQQKMQEQQMQMQEQAEQRRMEFQLQINQQNNETKMAIAQLQAQAQIISFDGEDERGYMEAQADIIEKEMDVAHKDKALEEKMKLEREKLKVNRELRLKEIEAKTKKQ